MGDWLGVGEGVGEGDWGIRVGSPDGSPVGIGIGSLEEGDGDADGDSDASGDGELPLGDPSSHLVEACTSVLCATKMLITVAASPTTIVARTETAIPRSRFDS